MQRKSLIYKRSSERCIKPSKFWCKKIRSCSCSNQHSYCFS